MLGGGGGWVNTCRHPRTHVALRGGGGGTGLHVAMESGPRVSSCTRAWETLQICGHTHTRAATVCWGKGGTGSILGDTGRCTGDSWSILGDVGSILGDTEVYWGL